MLSEIFLRVVLMLEESVYPDFTTQRAQRLSELKSEIVAPMKAESLKLLKEINRLTFENAISNSGMLR